MMKPLFRFIVNRPFWTILLLLLVAAPFLYYLPKLQMVENMDYITVDDDPVIAHSKRFKKTFDHQEFLIIVFKFPDIFQSYPLEIIQTLSDQIATLPEVDDVVSLSTVDDTIAGQDYYEVKPFLETIPTTPEGFTQKRTSAVSNPLFHDFIISKDGTTTAILVYPDKSRLHEEFRLNLVNKIKALLLPYQKKGVEFYLGGETYNNLILAQSIPHDIQIFIPLGFVLMIILATILFRSIKFLIYFSLTILIAMFCIVGFMGWSKIPFHNYTGLIPTIIMAVTMAASIHIVSHFQKQQSHQADARQAMISALDETYKPSLLTALTTIIGFASLTISHIPPIQQFGLVAAVGVLLSTFFSFTLLPVLLANWPPARQASQHSFAIKIQEWLAQLMQNISRYRYWIACIAVLLIAGLILHIPHVSLDTDLIDFFKPRSEIRTNNHFIENNLSGLGSLEVSLESQETDSFKSPEYLRYIEQLQNHMSQLPDVDRAISFVDYIKDINQSFHNDNPAYYRIPQTRELVAQYLILYDSDDIEDFINDEYNQARIIARTHNHSSRSAYINQQRIEKFIKKNPPPAGMEIFVLGHLIEEYRVEVEVVKSQVLSLLSALVVISLIMFFIFWSWPLGLLSLVPNLIPLLINFGMMGFLAIPLNSATALISATLLGLIVDDTIHLLYQYQFERRQGMSIAQAMMKSVHIKGPAVIVTSLVLSFGFAVAMLGSAIPVIQFGFLTSLLVMVALLADLILLPTMIFCRDPLAGNKLAALDKK